MSSVKVNVFISHAPEDKHAADLLQEWLYPMRDEVNVWHYAPPRPPEVLPLSWRILLPWYRPVDPRVLYAETMQIRRNNAHIYVFLTSNQALKSSRVEEDITRALTRRIDCAWEELAPMIIPVALSPSSWKETSRLSKFEPLVGGVPIQKFSSTEDAYIKVTNQLAALIKVMQVRLNEARFYHDHASETELGLRQATQTALPYLGENPEQFEFNPPAPFRPADWMGWSLIALIFAISAGSFRKNHPSVSSLHLKARPADERQTEYPRRVPMAPPPDTAVMVFPPVE